MKSKLLTIAILIAFILSGCNSSTSTSDNNESAAPEEGTFGYDKEFLASHVETVVLASPDSQAQVVIVPGYQGRVMTSTASGDEGYSFGWINHALISLGETLEHMNPYGGEERFWLGPEGGQYALFFKPNTTFDFENWQTPAEIDTKPFDVAEQTETSVTFTKDIQITNYADFTFDIGVKRIITIMGNEDLPAELASIDLEGTAWVGFSSENTITNVGTEAWSKETGLPSIWLLGMYNPSDEATVFIPYNTSEEVSDIEPVNDNYFDPIPEDRIKVEDGMIFFKADGKKRGKIGIPKGRALEWSGSYDAANNALTLVKCTIDEDATDYVNSAWEVQENPYSGDIINSYNDGPVEDGSQLGPFYEIETSSAVSALKPEESLSHSQVTMHFTGDEEGLNRIVMGLFNLELSKIKTAL